MNFLETIFQNLAELSDKPVLYEVREGRMVPTTARELSALIAAARKTLRRHGIQAGDRCVLLAPNSIQWVALDLAIMAEGGIVVPLYSRQAPEELAAMILDCEPALVCCGSAELREAVLSRCPEELPCLLLPEMLAGSGDEGLPDLPAARPGSDVVTIIYTSGTSGDAKGVMLTLSNISFMLNPTCRRLDELMADVTKTGDDRVFHYLPFCFAGSWILLLTCLHRKTPLMISTDLNRLADELKVAAPHYFLNVPALLERIRNGVQTQLKEKGGIGLTLFRNGQSAWLRKQQGGARAIDWLWLFLASKLVFSKIRAKIGPNLRALICGSAPLAEDAQLFFQMIGIPVLQVYGLTETTAICTLDDVHDVTVGRVGPAIPGIEMKLGRDQEILVRGPNIFPGYWRRPEATAEMIRDGWLHTGDQGEVDEKGNWKIVGRIKNLLITSGGHNVSPEPLEQRLQSALPQAEHVMVVGNNRKFLCALVTGKHAEADVHKAVEELNRQLPHYRQIRRFLLCQEPFTPENGLLTANRKLKRAAIEARYRRELDELYREAEDRAGAASPSRS
ncbi:MAG: AMP-binding protein [Acidobacteriota bacterium]